MEGCGTLENVVDCCGKVMEGCGTLWNRTMERNGRKWKEMEL